MRPFVGADDCGGVGRVFQRVVFRWEFAAFDLGDFGTDGGEGGDEAVEFGEGFGLGRFDHQGARDGEAHGWRVEAEVHEAFGDVVDGDADAVFHAAHVNDAFVGDEAVFTRVEDGEVLGDAFGQVVGG